MKKIHFPLNMDLVNKFIKIQKILSPTTAIEIGAYDAEFSHMCVEQNICNNIHAFEASPYVYNNFKEHMNQNINYKNIAIGDYDGNILFQLKNDIDFDIARSNSIHKNINKNVKYSYVDVEISKIDTLFKNDDNICFWIDAEGANKEVLSGAINSLKRTQSILIETEQERLWENQWVHDDVADFLNKQNFTMVERVFQGKLQSNCIFIKNDLLDKLNGVL
jgi:FkbM family methyltransferase